MAAAKKAKKKPASKRAKRQPRGEVLERTFKGKTHQVARTAGGFRYAGKEYGSLTAVAKRITGYKSISGPRFFGTATASTKRGATK